MKVIYSTGGREQYFATTNVRDCVTRAVANATGMDYLKIYNGINSIAKKERTAKRAKSSARNGVRPATVKKYIEEVLGWIWVPCMGIGTGCRVHVKEGELPSKGTYILSLSGHLSCWKDNKLYDTYDCSRGGSRCVYGYWREPTAEEKLQHQIKLAADKKMQEDKLAEKIKRDFQNKQIKSQNDKIKKAYSKKIHALKMQIKKLERERDSKLVSLVR